MKLTKIKQYLITPTKCYIPKCKSRCCINAPLPEDFLPAHESKIQRQIFGEFNMGVNDSKDTYNSVIYSTRPIIFIGYDQNGQTLATISPQMIEKLNIKSMEDIQRLLAEYEAKKIYNYCPFIKSDASCSVYSERPPICRDFGTAPGKENVCPRKASPLEIFRYKVQDFLSVTKEIFNNILRIPTKQK